MQTHLAIVSLAGLLFIPCQGYGQPKKQAVNFLSISGPISVRNEIHHLAWSSHPDESLYKQEYLAAGDQFPKYRSLVTVDFVVTGSTVDEAVKSKIGQLNGLKGAHSSVNYEVVGHKTTDEKIIDCLIVQTAADDRNSLMERNVFRYKRVRTKSGQEGLLLFAVSTRHYGIGIKSSLIRLKTDKLLLINDVANRLLPAIDPTR